MATLDFVSDCVQENKYRDTDTATWIEKHVPMSVSIWSNLIEQPSFLSKFNPGALMESLVDALDGLATQSKAQMKLMSLENETRVKSKLNQTSSILNHRPCRKEAVLEFEDACIEKQEEEDVLTQFLQTQKNQIVDLQDHLDKYRNLWLPSSSLWLQQLKIRHWFNKKILLPRLVNEQSIEPIVIKKTNQFLVFIFGEFQLVVIINFFEELGALIFSRKLTILQRRKAFFHMKSSMIQESATLLNFLLRKPSLPNCATTIPSKRTIQTFKVS